MAKETLPNVIIDKNSTYGQKPPVVVTSQGKDPSLTMSPHDKAESFIAKMTAERLANIKEIKPQKPQKSKSKISTFKKKIRGVKK